MLKNKSLSPLPPVKKDESKLGFSFIKAMEAITNSKKVRRIEWTDPEEYCLLKDSFLMIHRGDKFHQWIVSEGDMLSTDWVVIK